MAVKLVLATQPQYVHARYEKEKRGALKDTPITLRVVGNPDTKVLVEGRVKSTKDDECHKNYRLKPDTWCHSTGENLVLDDLRIVRIGKNGSKDASSRQNDSLGSFYIEFSALHKENGNYILGGSEATCRTEPIYDQCHDETRQPSLKQMIVSAPYADSQVGWIHCKRAVPKKNKVKARISISGIFTRDTDCKVDDRLVMFDLPRVPPEKRSGIAVTANVRLEICHESHVIESADSIDIQCLPDGSFNHPNCSMLETIKPKVQKKRKYSQRENGFSMQQDTGPVSKTFIESNRPVAKNQSQCQGSHESCVNGQSQGLLKSFYQTDDRPSKERMCRMEHTDNDLITARTNDTHRKEGSHGNDLLLLQTVDTGYNLNDYVGLDTQNHPNTQEIQSILDPKSHIPDSSHRAAYQLYAEDTPHRAYRTFESSIPPERKKSRYLSPEAVKSPIIEVLTNETPGLLKTFSEAEYTSKEKVLFRQCTDEESQFVCQDSGKVVNPPQDPIPFVTKVCLPIPECSYTDTPEQFEHIIQEVESNHDFIPSTEPGMSGTTDLLTFNCSPSLCSVASDPFLPQPQLDSMTLANFNGYESSCLQPAPNYQDQEMDLNSNLSYNTNFGMTEKEWLEFVNP